jgi:transcriptional regulator with XRE-family HTH domain
MSTVASETTEVVGYNVATLRTKAGMTQQQLADACEVARPRIAEIESGRFNPTVETVEAIATALGVSIEKLFRMPAKWPLAS